MSGRYIRKERLKMPSWWDSPEAVTKINIVLQWAAAILAVVLSSLIITTTNRANSLQAKEAARKEAEYNKRLEAAEKNSLPRRLTPEQREKLVAALARHKPNLTVFLSGSNEEETMRFASQIGGAVRSAGWDIREGSFAQIVPPAYGVAVRGIPADHPDFIALVAALKEIGIEPKTYGSAGTHFELFIGQRPSTLPE
jgi:hypothetical protein